MVPDVPKKQGGERRGSVERVSSRIRAVTEPLKKKSRKYNGTNVVEIDKAV